MNLLYSNILPLGTEEGQETVSNQLKEEIANSDAIEIAVGYVSKASLEELDRIVTEQQIHHVILTSVIGKVSTIIDKNIFVPEIAPNKIRFHLRSILPYLGRQGLVPVPAIDKHSVIHYRSYNKFWRQITYQLLYKRSRLPNRK